MNTQKQVALRCIDEIDALVAAVRYTDAAAAALQQPAEQRRPDFDEWLADRRARLQVFLDGRTDAPADLADFASYVTWLLKSYRKDARLFRFASWFVSRVLRMPLPLPDAGGEPDGPEHPLTVSAVTWVFVLGAVALWLATR